MPLWLGRVKIRRSLNSSVSRCAMYKRGCEVLLALLAYSQRPPFGPRFPPDRAAVKASALLVVTGLIRRKKRMGLVVKFCGFPVRMPWYA